MQTQTRRKKRHQDSSRTQRQPRNKCQAPSTAALKVTLLRYTYVPSNRWQHARLTLVSFQDTKPLSPVHLGETTETHSTILHSRTCCTEFVQGPPLADCEDAGFRSSQNKYNTNVKCKKRCTGRVSVGNKDWWSPDTSHERSIHTPVVEGHRA